MFFTYTDILARHPSALHFTLDRFIQTDDTKLQVHLRKLTKKYGKGSGIVWIENGEYYYVIEIDNTGLYDYVHPMKGSEIETCDDLFFVEGSYVFDESAYNATTTYNYVILQRNSNPYDYFSEDVANTILQLIDGIYFRYLLILKYPNSLMYVFSQIGGPDRPILSLGSYHTLIETGRIECFYLDRLSELNIMGLEFEMGKIKISN